MNRKEKATGFLQLIIAGDIREAYRIYTGKDFKHHNAYFKGDKESLTRAMEDEDRQNPDKIFNIQRVLEDGDFVAVHSHLKRNPEDPGIAVVHIFRFDNDIIVEFWDVAQFIPQDMVNENGMF